MGALKKKEAFVSNGICQDASIKKPDFHFKKGSTYEKILYINKESARKKRNYAEVGKNIAWGLGTMTLSISACVYFYATYFTHPHKKSVVENLSIKELVNEILGLFL